jgi:UDP-glucose 4-epimerase
MRIVVTGAHGFVGLNVARRLAVDGHTVVAVGRREPDRWVKAFLADVADTVEHRIADIGEQGSLEASLARDALDVVVHAAVVTATTAEVERDESRRIVAVNVGGTIEALELARAKDCRRFIYVSSPSAIGATGAVDTIDELIPTRPITLYGVTKLSSELLTRRFGDIHGLSTVSVRIAQPYGPGERATPSRPRTSPIWEWLEAARHGETLITGPPAMARDWTWVEDTARGIATLATAERLGHDLYHLSVGRLATVGEVLSILRERFPGLVTDLAAEHPSLNPNIGGAARRPPLDGRRFREDFGWAPEVEIADGMRRYLDWSASR